MHIIIAILFAFQSYSDLPRSFYQHEKKVEKRDKARFKASKNLRKNREKKTLLKEKTAGAYKKIREKKLKVKNKRQKQFENFESRREKENLKMQKKAKAFANKKRNKDSLGWSEENLELGIKPPPITKKSNSTDLKEEP